MKRGQTDPPQGAGMKHQIFESPRYSVPDRHAEGGDGTNAHGDTMHGSYKQPWVSVEPIADHEGTTRTG